MAEPANQNILDVEISEEPSNTDRAQDIADAWAKFNLLTLDGGGIRGYWSLLVLAKLMEYIAEEEEAYEDDSFHSFHPQVFPSNVSHVMTEKENNRLDHFDSHEHFKALESNKRYLPCHYFDCIGGTSTGGLIAIMLGRLRMTVPDCIHEYETFGENIFGKPRHFIEMNIPVIQRTKYDAERLKKVYQDVTRRRGENSNEVDMPKFASKSRSCRCFVTSLKAVADEKGKKRPATMQLIRSYDCDILGEDETRSARRGTTRSNTGASRNAARGQPFVKTGPADNFEIWQVARAATAARYYFKAMEIEDTARKETIIFEDGGLGHTSNPTQFGINDITLQEGPNAVGIVVSVGTARGELGRQKEGILGRAKRKIVDTIWNSSDPGLVHEWVEKNQRLYPNMEYWRLDPAHDEGGSGQLLNMPLDEWKPKKSRGNQLSGSKTLNEIIRAFDAWVAQGRVQNNLRDCAAQLVEQRRLRMQDEVRWERYAMVTDYKCCERPCSRRDRKFTDLQDFENHLKEEHGVRDCDLRSKKKNSAHPWKYRRPERSKEKF